MRQFWRFSRLFGRQRSSGTLCERIHFVDFDIPELLDCATGPANLDRVELCGGSEAEVHTHVTAGDITPTAANLVDQSSLS